MTLQDIIFLTLGVIGTASGLVGTALGIMNTVWQQRQNRELLQVYLTRMMLFDGLPLPGAHKEHEQRLVVHISNQRGFPVTVSAIAFEYGGSAAGMIGVPNARTMYEVGSPKLPFRLEARNSAEVYFSSELRCDQSLRDAKRLFIETACGSRFYVSRKQTRKAIRSYLQSKAS